MSYKIDITNIVGDHLRSLRNNETGKPDIRDWFFFLIIPIVIASTLVYFGCKIGSQTSNSMIAGMAIFVGLSINFLMIVFDISQKPFFKVNDKKSLLKVMIANIATTTIYSILIIILLLFADLNFGDLSIIYNFILYFLLIEFLMTLLMILKRIYILITGCIDLNK